MYTKSVRLVSGIYTGVGTRTPHYEDDVDAGYDELENDSLGHHPLPALCKREAQPGRAVNVEGKQCTATLVMLTKQWQNGTHSWKAHGKYLDARYMTLAGVHRFLRSSQKVAYGIFFLWHILPYQLDLGNVISEIIIPR